MIVTIAGGINYDLSIIALNKIIPFDSNPSKILYSSGGVGRNIAEIIGKSQMNNENVVVYLLGVVGDDPEGRYVVRETQKSNVKCDYVNVDDRFNTGKYITFNDFDNDMYVAANDMEIYDNLDVDIVEKWENILKKTDILIMDTNLDIKIINKVLSLIPEETLSIIETVSMNKIIKLKKLKYDIDILKTNKNEFMHFYGIEKEGQIFDMCKKIKSFHDIIITNKENKVIYFTDNEIKYIKTINSNVVNSNGAGDSFTAGLVYGILANLNIFDSIKYGNIFAYLSLNSESVFKDIIDEKELTILYRRYYSEN
jgi:pseudouridine kinase